MEKLKLVNKYADKFVSDHDIAEISGRAVEAMKTLHARNGEGNDFLGWVTLPTDYDKEEFSRIKKAAEYIQQNISQKLSLTDVSSAVHVSPSYLSHLFQKELGTTYIDYTNHLRIKHAARLLMEPSKITQVAVLSGFTDSKYFSKVFKQIMGESPKEYQLRVMRRENH